MAVLSHIKSVVNSLVLNCFLETFTLDSPAILSAGTSFKTMGLSCINEWVMDLNLETNIILCQVHGVGGLKVHKVGELKILQKVDIDCTWSGMIFSHLCFKFDFFY